MRVLRVLEVTMRDGNPTQNMYRISYFPPF